MNFNLIIYIKFHRGNENIYFTENSTQPIPGRRSKSQTGFSLTSFCILIFSPSDVFRMYTQLFLNEEARFYDVKVDLEDHHGHCSLGDQYCAAKSGAGWPGTATGTLTPGDIKPEITIFHKSLKLSYSYQLYITI